MCNILLIVCIKLRTGAENLGPADAPMIGITPGNPKGGDFVVVNFKKKKFVAEGLQQGGNHFSILNIKYTMCVDFMSTSNYMQGISRDASQSLVYKAEIFSF